MTSDKRRAYIFLLFRLLALALLRAWRQESQQDAGFRRYSRVFSWLPRYGDCYGGAGPFTLPASQPGRWKMKPRVTDQELEGPSRLCTFIVRI